MAYLQSRSFLDSILGGSSSKDSYDIFKQFSTPGSVLSGILTGDKQGLEALTNFFTSPSAVAAPSVNNLPETEIDNTAETNAIGERTAIETRGNRARTRLAAASSKPKINLARTLLGA